MNNFKKYFEIVNNNSNDKIEKLLDILEQRCFVPQKEYGELIGYEFIPEDLIWEIENFVKKEFNKIIQIKQELEYYISDNNSIEEKKQSKFQNIKGGHKIEIDSVEDEMIVTIDEYFELLDKISEIVKEKIK
jgi:hypothetical protein